jgi:hypothetical protein
MRCPKCDHELSDDGEPVAFGLKKFELKEMHARANIRFGGTYDKPEGVTGYEWYAMLIEKAVERKAEHDGHSESD